MLLFRGAGNGAAVTRKMLAAGSMIGVFLFAGICFRPWSQDHHAAEVGIFDRPGDRDGTFARCARL
jgi:hypothetical protein